MHCTNSKACKYLCLCDIFDRFCPYTTATLSSIHQISENSDQQQPQQRPASCGGGCGLLEPIYGKFGRGCRWKLRFRLKIAVVDGTLKRAVQKARLPSVVQHPELYKEMGHTLTVKQSSRLVVVGVWFGIARALIFFLVALEKVSNGSWHSCKLRR